MLKLMETISSTNCNRNLKEKRWVELVNHTKKERQRSVLSPESIQDLLSIWIGLFVWLLLLYLIFMFSEKEDLFSLSLLAVSPYTPVQ